MFLKLSYLLKLASGRKQILKKILITVVVVTAVYKFIWFKLNGDNADKMYRRLDQPDIFTPHYVEPVYESDDSLAITGERNRKRLWQIEEVCRALKYVSGARDQYHPVLRSFMNPKRDITWCIVNKVASTYTYGMLGSMFNCSQEQLFDIANTVRALPYSEMRQTIANSYKMMFVREPFGRLFSTYSNKFYYPKAHWAPLGPSMVKKYRKSPLNDSLKYGHDIKFHEMIRYTVEEFEAGHTMDAHISPMNARCYPCDYNFDFIGKLETLVSDWTYLKNTWLRKNIIQTLPEEGTGALLKFHETCQIQQTLELVKGSSIQTYNLYLRAWTYYKILGQIYKHIDMPFQKGSRITI